jgi:phosphoribosylformylglycinamidine (FGAM) synthase-like enzyme
VLFSESNSRFLIEVAAADKAEFEDLTWGKVCAQIGKVTKEQKLIVHGLNDKTVVDVALEMLRHAWKRTLSPEEATQ